MVPDAGSTTMTEIDDATVHVRCIAHCDADRFYYAVEARERPELARGDRPVIVGWDPRTSPRSIVTTANDAARALGINSGMSAAHALRLAPDAVFIQPRFEVYRDYSSRIMAVLRDESPLVEQLSIDEAWLDWRHRGFDPSLASRLRQRVLDEVGLSMSIGLSTSKLVAKMATELAKPGGVRVVAPGDEREFLRPLPVRALFGIGPRTAERLVAAGITTIGDIQAMAMSDAVSLLGRGHGGYIWEAARGIDHSELQSERQAKSYSAEHTFSHDTLDARQVWTVVKSQSAEVARRLIEDELVAAEVAVKVRYDDFTTFTRQVRVATTTDAEAIATAAAGLLRRHWDKSRPIRLIGVRAGRLRPAGDVVQLSLGLELVTGR
jgi:DNA polymerase-4